MTEYRVYPEDEATPATTDAEATATAAESVEGDAKSKKNKESGLKKENRELRERVEALEASLADGEDRYIRLAAEYDNFRKRTAKEKEGIYADAYGECIASILPVIDNLERALQFSEGDKVVEGVRMTMNQFSDILKKLGIEVIETEVFDPNFHNAVMHEENDELGEGVITDVFQKGYKKGDRVIRYAMVKVAN